MIGDGWITDALTGARDLTGDWQFNVYGKVTGTTLHATLRADVYGDTAGFLFSSSSVEDVYGRVNYYNFEWFEAVSGIDVPDGERLMVEFWLDVTAGGGSGVIEYYDNPDIDPQNTWNYFEIDALNLLAGSWQAAGGNPAGHVEIDSNVGAGQNNQQAAMAFWQDGFTPTFAPPSATLEFDWYCSAKDDTSQVQVQAYIDEAPGALVENVWFLDVTSVSTGWNHQSIDISAWVTEARDYYVEIGLYIARTRNDAADTILYDNVNISWGNYIAPPSFTMGYDNLQTPSGVIPVLNEFSGVPSTAYEIPMPVGAVVGSWVFVSFAYVMSGPIETVLDDSDITSGSGTQWDIAKWYDASDKNDPWKTYNKNNPASLNDLTTIDQTMGVWLHLTATDGTLTTGTLGAYSSVPVNVDLYTGWNLVGYPTENNEFANVALAGTGATWIASWQLAAPYVVDTTDLASTPMIEGEAYWVYVGSDTTWIVDPL